MDRPGEPLILASLPPLDTASALPLYAQLAERLAGAIRGRRAAYAGTVLPSEIQIMAHFGVSRPTVRQAMGQLVSAGVITRSRGRGSFVTPELLNHDVSLAFEDEMRAARKAVRFQLLSREVRQPSPDVQKALRLAPDAKAVCIERLRFLDDEPFAHEQRTMPMAVAAGMTAERLETLGIVSLLAASYERPARITNVVRCVPAEPRVRRLLGMRSRAPLLQTEHIYHAADGAPLLHGIVRFQWDRMAFTLDSRIDAAYGA
jgi:GntR family transcriptional regulator